MNLKKRLLIYKFYNIYKILLVFQNLDIFEYN